MKIKYLDEIYCQVEPKLDLQLIKPCLEYPSELWVQGPFGKKKKTGNAFLCDQRRGRFLAGLLPRIVEFAKNNKIAIDVQPLLSDLREDKTATLPGINLRPDQEGLLQKVSEFRRGLLVAPPGIGKTVLAGSIIARYPKSKAAMVVHTNSLFSQTIENFRKWFGNRVGVIGDGIYEPNQINVIMAKTALSICTPDDEGNFTNKKHDSFLDLMVNTDVMIVDESHHLGNTKGSYSCILERCLAPIRIGLTATPVTKKKEQLICEGYLGPIIGQITIQDGMEAGLLAKPKVELVPIPWNQTIADLKSYKDIYKYGVILNKARNRLIVKKAAERVANGESVLIMIVDVIHDQGPILQQLGKDLYDLDIEIVQGSTETETREKIKTDLQSKRTMCVATTTVWREGINIPSLDCVIWGAGGKSDIATLQGLGRGLRTTADKKTFYLIDFLDPYKYLSGHCIQRLNIYVEMGCL